MTFIDHATQDDMYSGERDEVLAISWDGCIYSTKGFPERTTFVMSNLSPQKKELFSLSIEMLRGHERQPNVTSMMVT